MTWDGMKKRISDDGGENLAVVLARIDERVKFLKDEISSLGAKMTVHMVSFEEHKIDDNKNFKNVNWWIAIGVGIVGTLQTITIIIKH